MGERRGLNTSEFLVPAFPKYFSGFRIFFLQSVIHHPNLITVNFNNFHICVNIVYLF
jgi:hypothetical protein